MNKRQKEVIASTLDDEKAVLQALEKNYTTALADIKRNIKELQANPLTQSKAYQLEFQKQLEKQLTGIVDNLHGKNFASIADYLNTCYNQGFLGTMYDLQGQGVPLVLPIDQEQVLKAVQKTGDNIKLANKLGISTNQLKKDVLSELQRGLATQLSYTDIARNISGRGSADMNRSMRIARTEGHRVQNEAKIDSLYGAKKKGADVVKQWDSTLDSSTRDTHVELDGQVRELDENFTCSGGSAPYPGGFGDPAEDCNCRCAMLQRARWAVKDETSYQKWNNETGGFIECTGYEDFKDKYLKASDHLKFAEENDILNMTNADLYDRFFDDISSALCDAESSKIDLNYEVGTILDLQGNVLNITDGQAHSVSPPEELLKGNIFTHNHPGGGCFSQEDIESFVSSGLYEVRASTPQGTFFSLRVDEQVDSGITKAYREATGISKCCDAIREDCKSGILTKEEAADFNTILKYKSKFGDEFLEDHAKEYGFIYKKGKIK